MNLCRMMFMMKEVQIFGSEIRDAFRKGNGGACDISHAMVNYALNDYYIIMYKLF